MFIAAWKYPYSITRISADDDSAKSHCCAQPCSSVCLLATRGSDLQGSPIASGASRFDQRPASPGATEGGLPEDRGVTAAPALTARADDALAGAVD